MGRDYYFVIIRDRLKHESDGKYCISLDYEPDYKEKVKIEDGLYDTKFIDCKQLDDLDDKHTDDFCQLCRWFLEPACYDNNYVVIDYHQVRLPDFRGDYFIDFLLYPNKVAYDYNQEGGGVYEITKNDVEDMIYRLNDIPEPKRESDTEQYQQSKNVLSFMETWIDEPNVKILMFTEY